MQKIHVDHWINIDNLVGGFNPSEKYEFVSWDDDSQLNGKSLFFFSFHGSSHHQAIVGKECLPSGIHTKNYGKSPFSMGKLTINHHFQ